MVPAFAPDVASLVEPASLSSSPVCPEVAAATSSVVPESAAVPLLAGLGSAVVSLPVVPGSTADVPSAVPCSAADVLFLFSCMGWSLFYALFFLFPCFCASVLHPVLDCLGHLEDITWCPRYMYLCSSLSLWDHCSLCVFWDHALCLDGHVLMVMS